jgi:hypothetical protein
MLANPRNCEMVLLGHDGHGRLRLTGRYELELSKRVTKENGAADNTDNSDNEVHVTGHRHWKRLRVLPDEYIRKVYIRISYDDDEPDNCVKEHH